MTTISTLFEIGLTTWQIAIGMQSYMRNIDNNVISLDQNVRFCFFLLER